MHLDLLPIKPLIIPGTSSIRIAAVEIKLGLARPAEINSISCGAKTLGSEEAKKYLRCFAT